jgi:hypothetical protein
MNREPSRNARSDSRETEVARAAGADGKENCLSLYTGMQQLSSHFFQKIQNKIGNKVTICMLRIVDPEIAMPGTVATDTFPGKCA